jgi:hypothetical protein
MMIASAFPSDSLAYEHGSPLFLESLKSLSPILRRDEDIISGSLKV